MGAQNAIERAMANGWKYDCECPEAGAGWTRLKRTRSNYRNAGTRVDFDYVAPDGTRFRSLVGAQFYSSGVKVRRGDASSTQRFQDCAVACAACASDEDAPGNDIVICDGACGLAFHQHCLAEPLWAVPEDKWLCPGCIEDSIARLPRYVSPPALYELDPHALRPSCTNHHCGGAVYGGEVRHHAPVESDATALPITHGYSLYYIWLQVRHAPVESDATAFRCDLCGTQLKSRWW
jgi:hypothetical protein|tara:strand:+ start:71 stop:775 length:705 start_codon:yes stop_codon:yes gene_type:complete